MKSVQNNKNRLKSNENKNGYYWQINKIISNKNSLHNY